MRVAEYLIELSQLPADWALVPVRGKKPYQKGWTKAPVCDRLNILKELELGKATGYGVRLGISGLLAIDVDGESAFELLKQFAGERLSDLETVSWTSGRSYRCQFLFRVPEGDRLRIRNLRIPTGINPDGTTEGLEFRWAGQQSVLPPSLHPDTDRAYQWLKAPWEAEVATAPEWLIAFCERWRPEYVDAETPDLTRCPVRLYSYFRRQLAVWLLARRFDNSKQKDGRNRGCGHGSFTLLAASRILERSKGHIRKLLCEAKKSGLIRHYKQQGDKVTVYYSSLEKAVLIAGLKELGPVACLDIEQFKDLNIIATEVEAQNLQRLSLYCKRQEEKQELKQQGKDPNKTPTQIQQPGHLLTCENSARVLAQGPRYLYCEAGFNFYGGSQQAIANTRGISQRTVSRHLSNRYRLQPAPQRGYRGGLTPVLKKQLAERLPHLRHLSREGVWQKLLEDDGLFWAYQDWWKPRCNIYLLEHRLISMKRRRGRLNDKGFLFASTAETAGGRQ